MGGDAPTVPKPKKKAKNAKDKELTEEEKASSSLKAFGFPIEDFGNDGGGGFSECLYHPLISHS